MNGQSIIRQRAFMSICANSNWYHLEWVKWVAVKLLEVCVVQKLDEVVFLFLVTVVNEGIRHVIANGPRVRDVIAANSTCAEPALRYNLHFTHIKYCTRTNWLSSIENGR